MPTFGTNQPIVLSIEMSQGVASFRSDGRLEDVEVKTGVGDVRLDGSEAT